MATVKTVSVLVKTSDSNGSGSLNYNESTHTQTAPIKLVWMGGSVSFNTVLEYQTFLSEVIIPITNIVNSPSGAGVGYIASTAGVAGSDKVSN